MHPVITVKVGPEPFDCGREQQTLEQASPGAGAICTFQGLVRESGDTPGVKGLIIEHYPGMTERAIEKICNQAAQRWPVIALAVTHRTGTLVMGETIVFVGVSSEHRSVAFDACEFIMDSLKTQAPFWKKEWTDAGSRWVEQKDTDIERAQRWKA